MNKFIVSSMMAMTMSAVLAIEAIGQDFAPLAQWLTQPEGKKNKIYAFERCAALNTAILAHGEKTLIPRPFGPWTKRPKHSWLLRSC